MIRRDRLFRLVTRGLETSPVVALLGPRQCGKTTLARAVAESRVGLAVHYFDLEDERTFAQFQNPMMRLESLAGLVVLDEFQRLPSLLPALRVEHGCRLF